MKKHIYLYFIRIAVITALLANQGFCEIAVHGATNTYYVDMVNGSDSNDGLSEHTPWKTLDNIKSKAFASGDTILFHRGQKWYQAEFSPNCSSITYGAYGEGDRPILSGAKVISGWEIYDGTIYSIETSTEEPTYLMKIDGSLIKRDQKATVQELPENRFMKIGSRLYFNSPFGNPDEAGKITEIQVSHHIFNIYAKKNIRIMDLSLTMTGGALIYIQGGDSTNITVSNNELSFAESGYSDGSGISCSGTRSSLFTGNVIHDVFGDGILLWNCSDITVSNNHITRVMQGVNTGGDGIQSSGKLENSAPNNKILNNFVSMEGSDTPKGCIQQENGDNVVISGNTCLYGYFGIEANSNYGLVENNYCAYQGYTASPVNWSAGLYMSEDLDITEMTWHNNIVYKCKPMGFHINQANKRSKFRIYNNTIYNSGTAFKCTSPFSGEIKNNIFWNDNPSSSTLVITTAISGEELHSDYNILGQQVEGQFISYLGNNYDTIWTFRNVTGNDINSKITRPLFVNAEQKDFRLYSNSPGVDAGTDVGITKDFEGQDVPQGNGFNIGAVEGVVLTDEKPEKEPEEPTQPTPEYYQDGLLAYESFDYPPTASLNGLGDVDFGWNGVWAETVKGEKEGRIGTSGMCYNGVYDKGYKALFTSAFTRQLEKPVGQETGIYWVSFLAKNNNPARELYISLNGRSGTNITIKQRNTETWKIDKNYSGRGAYNITNFVLLKLSITDSKTTVYMWVNPSLTDGEAGLGTPHLTYYINEQFVMTAFTMGMSTGTTVYAEIDEIRIAKNYNAAVMQQLVQQTALKANKLTLLANGKRLSGTIAGLPDEVIGKAVVFNAVSQYKSKRAYYIIGLYREGRLKRVMVQTDEILLGQSKYVEVKLSRLGDLEQGDYVIKFMIWDYEQLSPISECYTVNIVSLD